jgi:hypothetical protein
MALGQQLRERATRYYLWPEAGKKILQVYREVYAVQRCRQEL